MSRHSSSKSRWISPYWSAMVCVIVVAGAVICQPPEGVPPSGGPPPWARERIQTVIIGKFSSELDLTPEQAEKFFPRFKQFQNDVENAHRQTNERRRMMEELSRSPNADRSQVTQLLREQSEQEQRVSVLKESFLADVAAFLTPQQVSRCSILLDEVPRRIREFMEERRLEKWRGGEAPPEGQPAPGRHRRRGY